jgi:hypothetical protein
MPAVESGPGKASLPRSEMGTPIFRAWLDSVEDDLPDVRTSQSWARRTSSSSTSPPAAISGLIDVIRHTELPLPELGRRCPSPCRWSGLR